MVKENNVTLSSVYPECIEGKGMQQTEIGLIPEDWEVKKLSSICHRFEYGTSAKARPAGSIAVLRMGNLQNGKICWDDLVYSDNVNDNVKYLLNKNDVLFNRTNSIDLVGKTSIYKAEHPAIFAGYLIRIHPDKSVLDSDFLNYQLNTKSARAYGLSVVSIGVSQANINASKLGTYIIPLPPLHEQQAISEALSAADAWIENLEDLIAKKRLIKQGAMQELLRPKEGWEVKKLGEILLKIAGGGTPPRASKAYWNGEIPWMTVKDFASFNPNFTQEYISEAGLKNSATRLVKAGNLILATRIALGQIARYNVDVAINQDLKTVELADLVTAEYFIFYYRSIADKVIEKGSGSTVLGLSIADLKNFDIHLPTVPEQTRIATILSDMDTEIEQLVQKLTKARQIKQGMMQELLTGRVRLV